MTDPIADFLTRLRNAARAGKREVSAPYSQVLMRIAEILKREGFLEDVGHKGRGHRKLLVVRLRFIDEKPALENLRRVSRPGRRVYRRQAELRPVKSGFGIAIVSTPAGIMTGREAKKQKIGGEVLCEVW